MCYTPFSFGGGIGGWAMKGADVQAYGLSESPSNEKREETKTTAYKTNQRPSQPTTGDNNYSGKTMTGTAPTIHPYWHL